MQRPIFIVGTMRSGSTLFRLVLDSHPAIAIGEETGFMGALAAAKAIPSWRYGKEWYGRLGWDEDELDARLRNFYTGMFERFAADQGKQRWGDKTPFHAWHIAEMARIFPDAVFVAIVRHPGAVVASMHKHFHYAVGEAAEYWENTNTEILRHAAELGDKRFALVRYEDLVEFPEPTMRGLLTWLDEPWAEDVVRHAEVQAAKGAPRVVDGNTSTRDPIRPDRAVRWTSSLTEGERQLVRSTTGSLAAFLGYTPTGAQPLADGPDPERVLTGGQVARRQDEFGDTLIFAPRVQGVVLAEMSKDELATRLREAETSLARIRSRPVVRLSETVRRVQRELTRSSPVGSLLSRSRRSGRERPGGRSCAACGWRATTWAGLTAEGRYRLHRCDRCRSQFFVDGSAASSDDRSHYKWETYKLDVYRDQQVRDGFEGRYRSLLHRARSEVGTVQSVLDIGCGIGNFVEFAEREGLTAVGSDVSEVAVAEARRRGLRVHLADELAGATSDGSFDAVTMWDVIEHVSTPGEMLASVVPKVRPGGALLFETPDGGFPIRTWLLALNRLTRGRVNLTGPMYYWEHKVYLTEAGMRALLDEAGADIVHIERQTSVRAKMAREFAEKRSRKGRALKLAWPALEALFRRGGWGNKLLIVAQRR